jgi:Raf kinase inhibitor-like YbhB/YbcL family protein
MKASAFCLCASLVMLGALPARPYGSYPRDPIFQRGWGMQIISPAFGENDYIPGKYTCDGDNISPPLHISGVSSKTLTLVLIMEDPDALNGDWVHWTVWNMDAATRVISENSIPDGSVEGDTDFEMPAWLGPCPRWGVHRYVFRLFALDVKLDLTVRASKGELEKAMQGHILDQSALVGLYGRDPVRAVTDTWIQRKSTN